MRRDFAIDSPEIRKVDPGHSVQQFGPPETLISGPSTGLIRMQIFPRGWVTVDARAQGGPLMLKRAQSPPPPEAQRSSSSSSSSSEDEEGEDEDEEEEEEEEEKAGSASREPKRHQARKSPSKASPSPLPRRKSKPATPKAKLTGAGGAAASHRRTTSPQAERSRKAEEPGKPAVSSRSRHHDTRADLQKSYNSVLTHIRTMRRTKARREIQPEDTAPTTSDMNHAINLARWWVDETLTPHFESRRGRPTEAQLTEICDEIKIYARAFLHMNNPLPMEHQ